jgi:hypothetical protein
MKKTFLVLPFAALALASCGTASSSSGIASSSASSPSASSSSASSSDASSSSTAEDYAVKFVTPVGAPAIAFYDQGHNANWVSSSDPTNVVLPAFGTDNYDAIVFDGTTGLNVIKKNSYNYKLAQWVSGGNFYVVSTKHQAGEAFASDYKVDGFVKTGNAAQSFLSLAAHHWNWALDTTADYPTGSVKWEAGVTNVLTNLTANPTGFDYYVIAEPSLTAAKTALAAQNIGLNIIYNLQTEWKAQSGQLTIPAAALFVNNASYDSHKDAIDEFLAGTQIRQDTAVDDVATVKTALDAFGNDAAVQSRFGFTSTLAAALQANGADKFGILKIGDIADKEDFANSFAKQISGLDTIAYGPSLFL